jgi:hypothetical protein
VVQAGVEFQVQGSHKKSGFFPLLIIFLNFSKFFYGSLLKNAVNSGFLSSPARAGGSLSYTAEFLRVFFLRTIVWFVS